MSTTLKRKNSSSSSEARKRAKKNTAERKASEERKQLSAERKAQASKERERKVRESEERKQLSAERKERERKVRESEERKQLSAAAERFAQAIKERKQAQLETKNTERFRELEQFEAASSDRKTQKLQEKQRLSALRRRSSQAGLMQIGQSLEDQLATVLISIVKDYALPDQKEEAVEKFTKIAMLGGENGWLANVVQAFNFNLIDPEQNIVCPVGSQMNFMLTKHKFYISCVQRGDSVGPVSPPVVAVVAFDDLTWNTVCRPVLAIFQFLTPLRHRNDWGSV